MNETTLGVPASGTLGGNTGVGYTTGNATTPSNGTYYPNQYPSYPGTYPTGYYNCPKCGAYLQQGVYHSCGSFTQYPQPQYIYVTNPDLNGLIEMIKELVKKLDDITEAYIVAKHSDN